MPLVQILPFDVGVNSRHTQPRNSRYSAREWIVESKGRRARWSPTVAAGIYVREVLNTRGERAAGRRPGVEQIGVQAKATTYDRILLDLIREAESRLDIRLTREEFVGEARRRGGHN